MYQRCEKCVFVQEVAALVYQRCDEHVFVQEMRLLVYERKQKASD